MLTKDIEIAFLRRKTVGSMTLTGESTTWPITNAIKPARYLMVGFKNLQDSQTNNNNVFRVAMNQNQDPIIHKVQVRLNNDNYPNQPLTINPSTKDYNELYRNYKHMCDLFGNPPQFEYALHVTGDEIDLQRIGSNTKEGGFLPLLPLILAGITAADAATGGISAADKAANAKKAAGAKTAEERRHNLATEKEARGSGVADILGTVKEFGNRFSQETKKTVKEGLSNLIDKIDTGEMKVKYKGNGIFKKNIYTLEKEYFFQSIEEKE
ncbi:hypothetical protein LOTGIDRAFT_158801 [Lottia gigantea]|uniref:Uncharacterized protein n=1 Tax=Lottia gigantea TaxID=225164 RepID=V4ANV8_LOTGI|nr:hypothetical protein LOTGIDRAFT_158801 [Lottia gigantea]ESO98852.1 hypothetical protein LOTGIDRAFT_158801 [Lottia gigantea]